MADARTMTMVNLNEHSPSRVDSVLDCYTHSDTPLQEKHTSGSIGQNSILNETQEHSIMLDRSFYQRHGFGSPSEQSDNDHSYYGSTDEKRTNSTNGGRGYDYHSTGSQVKRHHSLSRIPQLRYEVVKNSAPGEATRASFAGNTQEWTQSHSSDVSSHSNRSKITQIDKPEAASMLPRSVSLPMQSLVEFEKPRSRNVQIDKHASLPSRKRSRAAAQMRRSASVSRPSSTYSTEDAKLAREEQARRIHAVNNAPTGRPPWLDRFQPDARTPVDQQLLPTIARKIALEKSVGMDRGDDDELLRPKAKFSISERVSCSEATQPQTSASALDDTQMINVSTQAVMLGQDPTSLTQATSSTPNFSRRSAQEASSRSSGLAERALTQSDHLVPSLSNAPITKHAVDSSSTRESVKRSIENAGQTRPGHARPGHAQPEADVRKRAVCCRIM